MPMVLRSLVLNRRDAERVVEALRETRSRKAGDEAAAYVYLLSHAVDTLDSIVAAEKAARASQRWTPICGDCWQRAEPDQYVPDLTGYEECGACGHLALTVNVHPEVIRKAVEVQP